MIAEGTTKKPIVAHRGLLRQHKREVGKLFTNMANDNAAEDPFGNAEKKIRDVRDFVRSLREQYPKEKFPMRNKVFDGLEASCEKAEERMRRVRDRHHRKIGIAS